MGRRRDAVSGVILLLSVTVFGPQEPRASATTPGDVAEPVRPSVQLEPVDRSTGRRVTLASGGDLQRALNEAVPGDVIVLEAGAVFRGRFILPKKRGAGWVTISAAGMEDGPSRPGRRITPSDAHRMPKIVSTGPEPAIATDPGAHRYRFVGVEFTLDPAVTTNYGIIVLGSRAQRLGEIPQHLVFERCYIHGREHQNVHRGIELNSASTAIVDSHISDIHYAGVETQAIAGWNGPGPFLIQNNYIEGASINVLFGGADPSIPQLVPSDIELRGNHFHKPLSWRRNGANASGRRWAIKNLFEIKAARRVLVEGNVFEHSWADAQEGWAVRFVLGTDRDAAISDITFDSNIIKGAAHGLDICGRCAGTSATPVSRVAIRNNVFTDIGGAAWTTAKPSGWALMLRNGVRDISVERNTFVQRGSLLVMDGTAGERLVFARNIAAHNEYGVFGSPFVGKAALERYFRRYVFTNNVLFAVPSGVPTAQYPAGNMFAKTIYDVGFMDAEGGNFRLGPKSPYSSIAERGGLGVDFDRLATALPPGVRP
jgi:hypothetical protein